MSYHLGAWNLPSPKDVTLNIATALTPTGLLWMAPNAVQQNANKQINAITGGSSLVAQAQGYLVQLGLFPGPVTGNMDPNTQQALDTFRKAVGFPTGGPVTQADVSGLGQAVAQAQANTGVTMPPPGPSGAPASGLPAWALPVGLAVAVGGLLLLRKG